MQKKNRIMMIAVSSLLCLTLISSCLVSSVFARYVTKDSAKVSTVFKKFGITVEMTPSQGLANAVTNKNIDNNSVSLSFGSLQLAPGEDFSDAVKIKVSGSTEVKTRVRLIIDLTYTSSNFNVPADISGGENANFIPIGFTYGYQNTDGQIVSSYVAQPWCRSTAENMAKYICDGVSSRKCVGIKSKIDLAMDGTTIQTNDMYKDFLPTAQNKSVDVVFLNKANGNAPINEFYLGFNWPMEWTPADTGYDKDDKTKNYDFDKATMYLTNRDTPLTIGIKYTVVVEQIQ